MGNIPISAMQMGRNIGPVRTVTVEAGHFLDMCKPLTD
jgi:hypothetical protein